MNLLISEQIVQKLSGMAEKDFLNDYKTSECSVWKISVAFWLRTVAVVASNFQKYKLNLIEGEFELE